MPPWKQQTLLFIGGVSLPWTPDSAANTLAISVIGLNMLHSNKKYSQNESRDVWFRVSFTKASAAIQSHQHHSSLSFLNCEALCGDGGKSIILQTKRTTTTRTKKIMTELICSLNKWSPPQKTSNICCFSFRNGADICTQLQTLKIKTIVKKMFLYVGIRSDFLNRGEKKRLCRNPASGYWSGFLVELYCHLVELKSEAAGNAHQFWKIFTCDGILKNIFLLHQKCLLENASFH